MGTGGLSRTAQFLLGIPLGILAAALVLLVPVYVPREIPVPDARDAYLLRAETEGPLRFFLVDGGGEVMVDGIESRLWDASVLLGGDPPVIRVTGSFSPERWALRRDGGGAVPVLEARGWSLAAPWKTVRLGHLVGRRPDRYPDEAYASWPAAEDWEDAANSDRVFPEDTYDR